MAGRVTGRSPSDESRYVTGVTLPIDAGLLIK